ncbi:MAG TPA: hypothetical protein VFQ35_01905, partial [Polyangiaceae bacterium]|nr:hypothetical protein [Polyangiaceae bacterium]
MPASAQTETIRIDYKAVPGCPSAEDFNAEVMKRTQSARLSESDARVRTFIVEIEQRRGGLIGSLRVREGRTETVAREVQGDRCADVASTLALATALAIDPHASTSPAASASNGSAANPPTTGGAGATGDADAGPQAAGASRDKDGKAGEKSETRSPPRAPEDSFDFDPSVMRSNGEHHVAFELGPSLLVGVTPGVAFGGSISAQMSNSRSGALLSAYGADLTLLRAPTSETAGASATFQLLYARPIACGIQLGHYDGISLSPCLGADVGVISGWGSDLPHEESHTKLWAALELFARLRIGGKNDWSLEAQAGPTVPLTRYDFVFQEPRTQVHTV